MRKDGFEYWQELHISPVLDAEGNAIYFIGIEPNISERKTKDRFREEFMSILGHQSLTPLAGIRWALQWLMDSGGITKEQQKVLNDVYRQSEGLANLVQDLILERKGHVQVRSKGSHVRLYPPVYLSGAKKIYCSSSQGAKNRHATEHHKGFRFTAGRFEIVYYAWGQKAGRRPALFVQGA